MVFIGPPLVVIVVTRWAVVKPGWSESRLSPGKTEKLAEIFQGSEDSQDDDDLALERGSLPKLLPEPREGPPEHPLVELGELTGDRRRPVAELRQGIVQARQEPVG